MIVSAYCVCSHIGYNQTMSEDNSGPSSFFVFFCFPRVSRDILMPICRAHCIMYSQNMSDDYSDPDSFFVVFCFPRVSCRRSRLAGWLAGWLLLLLGLCSGGGRAADDNRVRKGEIKRGSTGKGKLSHAFETPKGSADYYYYY